MELLLSFYAHCILPRGKETSVFFRFSHSFVSPRMLSSLPTCFLTEDSIRLKIEAAIVLSQPNQK